MPWGEQQLGYTFLREHPAVYVTLNALIRRLVCINANVNDVAGNVLVVKHVWGRKDDSMNCEEANMSRVSGIIKQ